MQIANRKSKIEDPKSGFTLIELLVVILIIGLVAGVTIPVIAPALDGRRIRESSRLITAYLNGARDTAMRNGRPVGVLFERYIDPTSGNALPGMSVVLRQVEVPPPYSGDTVNSRMSVVSAGTNLTAELPVAEVGWQGIVRIGDFVKLNYRGPIYQITGGGNPNPSGYLQGAQGANAWILTPQANGPVYSVATLVPFQVMRQPVKSSAQPLQLPDGVIIELNVSGYGAGGIEYAPIAVNDTLPVAVMFSPSGMVERVFGSTIVAGNPVPVSVVPSMPIHFLLGKRERLLNTNPTDITADGMMNHRDLENLWITIWPQSGLITSSPVAEVAAASTGAAAIGESRTFAAQGRGMGGR